MNPEVRNPTARPNRHTRTRHRAVWCNVASYPAALEDIGTLRVVVWERKKNPSRHMLVSCVPIPRQLLPCPGRLSCERKQPDPSRWIWMGGGWMGPAQQRKGTGSLIEPTTHPPTTPSTHLPAGGSCGCGVVVVWCEVGGWAGRGGVGASWDRTRDFSE